MILVCDTNIFISALRFGGNPDKIIQLAREDEIKLAISPFILNEFERILGGKFHYKKKETRVFRERIENISFLVNPTTKISVIKEKDDDNRILECALEAKATYIITGDRKHILPLKNFRGVKIITAAQFLEKLGRKE